MLRRQFLSICGSLPLVGLALSVPGAMADGMPVWREVDTPDGKLLCLLVVNKSGSTLLPGRLVVWDKHKQHIIGYATKLPFATNGGNFHQLSGVSMCPRDGVQNGRKFWVAVRGVIRIATRS